MPVFRLLSTGFPGHCRRPACGGCRENEADGKPGPRFGNEQRIFIPFAENGPAVP
jgi:hypothetical protein